MANPIFEIPTGVVDGANRVFTTSKPYSIGSTAVFLNGVLQGRALDDGWYETSPDNGVITMKEAPSNIGTPDVVQVFYLDRSPSPPPPRGTVARRLRGIIRTSVQTATTTPSGPPCRDRDRK